MTAPDYPRYLEVLAQPDKVAQILGLIPTGAADDCWIWRGQLDRLGYGWVRWHPSRKTYVHVQAHVAAYLLANPAPPPDHEIVHTCATKCCMNPAHLIAMTTAERIDFAMKRHNILRYRDDAGVQCVNGHWLSIDNQYIAPGRQGDRPQCRRCIADSAAAYKKRRALKATS